MVSFDWVKVLWTVFAIMSAAINASATPTQPQPIVETQVAEEKPCEHFSLTPEVLVTYADRNIGGKIYKNYPDYDYIAAKTFTLNKGDVWNVEIPTMEDVELLFVITSVSQFEIHEIYTSSGGGEKLHRSDWFFNGDRRWEGIHLSDDAVVMSKMIVVNGRSPIEVTIWPREMYPKKSMQIPVEVEICK